MKLGKDTGSFVNYYRGNTISQTPEINMGATLLSWSDRDAYTIHKVEGKKLWASQDNAKRIDSNGMSESQTYEYSNDNISNEDLWEVFTLRKDGRWHRGNTLKGLTLLVGKRETYYDFSF